MKERHPVDLIAGLMGVIAFGIMSAESGSRQLSADEPGWRSGKSAWNGSGYDLPVTVEAELPQQVVTTEPPYVVPADPGAARTNPYFQPSGGVQQGMGNDSPAVGYSPAVGFSPPEVPTGESVSDLVESLTDPYGQSRTPSKPVITTSDALSDSGYTSTSPAADVKPEVLSPTDQTAAASTYTEPPPLQQDVVRWYQYPKNWMKGWDSHAELGVDGSDGNANTLAIQTGLELKRKTDLHTLAIDIDYRQANSNNKTTENNGRLNIDYDRIIADSQWSAFGKLGLEWDQFKAFDLRLNLNGGLGYHWIREDNASLVTRFGAGASREFGAPIDEWTPEAVFGIDAERQLNARNKLKGKLDYFPAWEDFGDYRVVADAAWEILLDDSDNLSLKLAVTDRYDSTPQGAKPNDVYYSLLLLYKF